MRTKKNTVTIGIPAYNEAGTITSLLHTLLKQKQTYYILEEIIVICDGCLDDTEERVKQLASVYPQIHIISDVTRKGKAQRLNELYALNSSDILVTLDADITLDSSDALNELIMPLGDATVGIVGGNPQPVKGGRFTERVINTWYKLWYETRKRINNGDAIHNTHGAATALRGTLAKTITFPTNTIATAQYLYFATHKARLSFYFAEDAIVRFYSPTSLQDYFSLIGRYGHEKQKLTKTFGIDIYKAYYVPFSMKLKAFLKIAIQDPLYLPFVVMLYVACKLRRGSTDSIIGDGLWEQVASTKRTAPASISIAAA